MRKLNTLLTLTVIVLLGFSSCKKKGCMDENASNYNPDAKKDDGSCVYSPTITLNGDATMTISVGSGYVDPGATAVDNEGTSIVVSTDSSMVNDSIVGSFTVTYSASNQHGTTTATRTVNVIINHENWPGSWSVADDCGGGTSGIGLNSSPNIIAGANNNQIIMNDFRNGATSVFGTSTCNITGADIEIPEQTTDANANLGTITYSGFGTMADDGKSFVVTYTYNNTTPFTGTSGTCVATFTKQ